MRGRRAVALVALAVVLVACSEPKVVDRGVILRHDHDPMWMQPVSTGKTTTFIVHPERWHLCYEGDTVDGRHGRECREVDEGTWRSCDDGDWIDFVEHICRPESDAS